MLQNAYFVAKIGADTAENEQHFAEILPTDALWRLRRVVEEVEVLSHAPAVYVVAERDRFFSGRAVVVS